MIQYATVMVWSGSQSCPVVAWLESSAVSTHTRHNFLTCTPFIKVIVIQHSRESKPMDVPKWLTSFLAIPILSNLGWIFPVNWFYSKAQKLCDSTKACSKTLCLNIYMTPPIINPLIALDGYIHSLTYCFLCKVIIIQNCIIMNFLVAFKM